MTVEQGSPTPTGQGSEHGWWVWSSDPQHGREWIDKTDPGDAALEFATAKLVPLGVVVEVVRADATIRYQVNLAAIKDDD